MTNEPTDKGNPNRDRSYDGHAPDGGGAIGWTAMGARERANAVLACLLAGRSVDLDVVRYRPSTDVVVASWPTSDPKRAAAAVRKCTELSDVADKARAIVGEKWLDVHRALACTLPRAKRMLENAGLAKETEATDE